MTDTIVADKMSPKERIKAFNEGKAYDRIPVNPSLGEHAALVIGIKVSEYHHSAAKMAEGQIAAYRKYGHDGVSAGSGSIGIIEALGAKVVYPDYSSPYVDDYPIKSYADFDRLTIPDPKNNAHIVRSLEALEILVRRVGDEAPVGFHVSGAVSLAAKLRGIENLMRDFYKNKEFAHKLLKFCVECTLPVVREAAKLGPAFGIGEPTASGSLISKAHFREFALPYLKMLTDGIKEVGDAPELHICGDTSKVLDLMVETGARALSLDNMIDLEFAKEAVGDKIRLTGNIRPTETMYLGNPATVEQNVRENLAKAYDSPKGYILRLGCGLPINTPPENIHALVNSAKKYGRYPYDPALFS